MSSGGSRPHSDREGGGHRDPEKKGGAGLPKSFFRPFGPHFGPKIRGGGVGRPGPSPGSATERVLTYNSLY